LESGSVVEWWAGRGKLDMCGLASVAATPPHATPWGVWTVQDGTIPA
jgi:hypothetical protein